MTLAKIKATRKKLENSIATLENKLKQLKQKCPHKMELTANCLFKVCVYCGYADLARWPRSRY